jgi:plastocyanin
MVNSRRFNPSVATIPKEGFIEFLNIDADAITIEANDENSKILNIGTLEPSDIKEVRFNAPGTYTYRNKEKPQMTGIIIIK